MANYKKENFTLILFILCTIILGTAFFIEYFLGYIPCNLCKIERIPYGLSMIILIVNYKFKGNQIFYSILLILIFSFSIIISIYHLGIEQGFIDESTVCVSENLNLLTKEEILNSLNELRISCKDVAFKVFGFSLTTYNMISSIMLLILSIKIYLISNDVKK